MTGFSFPDASRLVPRYVDAPLGPVDRLHSWLGWTIEANPLFGSPAKMLRNEDGTLLYGDDGQVAYGSHGEPVVLAGAETGRDFSSGDFSSKDFG